VRIASVDINAIEHGGCEAKCWYRSRPYNCGSAFNTRLENNNESSTTRQNLARQVAHLQNEDDCGEGDGLMLYLTR
jgi:hypothetical protein